MQKSKTVLAKDLSGLFIYYDDKKRRTLYKDFFSKKAYIINNSDVKKYSLFSSRYLAAFIIAILVVYYLNNEWLGIAIGVASLVIFEILFRVKFLGELSVVEDFIVPKKEGIIERTSKYSYSSLILSIVISFAFGIWYFINTLKTDYTIFMKICNYAISLVPLALGTINVIGLIKKTTQKD